MTDSTPPETPAAAGEAEQLLADVAQVLCDGLLFVPHPIVDKARATLLAALRDEPAAKAMAEALRDELLVHRRR